VRLAGKKKLRRIRDTLYEDPGNPFASEDEIPKMPMFTIPSLSTKPADQSRTNHERPQDHAELLIGNSFDGAEITESPESATGPETSLSSFASWNGQHLITLQRQGLPTVINPSRRSMSVALIPEQQEETEEYVHPRAQWRRESVPAHRLPQQARQARQSTRDSKFYDFYDDILRDCDTNTFSKL